MPVLAHTRSWRVTGYVNIKYHQTPRKCQGMEKYVRQTRTKDDFIFARDVKTDKHDFYMYEIYLAHH